MNKFIDCLQREKNWVQVAYSKHEPKAIQAKMRPLAEGLYKNPNSFTSNPGICRTELIKQGFNNLLQASKEERAANEGFEYFVSRYFERQGLVCVIHEPADGTIISHEGYLESTPRNWHMTNSIDQNAENYLLAMPKAPLWRRFLMASRLTVTFFKLAFKQFANNEIYELSFRILAAVKNTRKNG